ncbi:hypothetical protein QBC34DRAFT_431095 [Podospora aff. communis PSN243]|uniref:Cyanovirin-N domain-containing protein n=1 Tax=Podospora aff. communis PSN243 TaxID=3040156 RepID=A0AAV9G666_9PEZI|nr:hypothetical protein QBC34DRAFT_431095 [Podospora aff. communis PSN243]
MHLPTIASILVLATTAAADSLVSYTECALWGFSWSCKSHRAVWFAADGGHSVSAEGCTQGAPGMRELCVDFDNWRGHFYYHGQGKRCIVHKHRLNLNYDWSNAAGDTLMDNWDEVKCTW